jgi:competence protein ComFC
VYLKADVKNKNGVVSFYDYGEIDFLIKYKYKKFGHRIFEILSRNSLKVFSERIKEDFYLLPVDDKTQNGFSHTAVMVNEMKNRYLKPLYGCLRSESGVKYAGRSLEFRLKNPRNFIYTGPENIDVILVDDIRTTGLTLKEAEETLSKYGVNVALCAVLADLGK